MKIEDTPKFRELETNHRVIETPAKEIFTTYRREVITSIGVTSLNAVGFYLILSYMPTYLITELQVGETEAFLTVSISLAVYVFSIFAMGAISDRIGRKVALISASVLFIILTVPLFALLDDATLTGIILIQIAFGILLTVNDGTLPCFLTEIFPTRVRYSGFAFSFNTAQAFLGGTAPLIATFLIEVTGSKLAPAWYLVAIAAVSLIAMRGAKETAGKPLVD